MQQITHEDMKVLFPEKVNATQLVTAKIRKPFDSITVEFIDNVSKILFRDSRVAAFPDIVTLAFWMRKSNLKKLEEAYLKRRREGVFIGRGLVFHITPSNVAVNFMYSLVASMLAGNNNVIKLAPKNYEQEKIIISAIAKVLEKPDYDEIKKGLCIVKYGIINKITDYFSSICDVRVVWGGNATIAAVRTSPLPPRSTEILFADRYSFCVLDAGAVLKCDSISEVAQRFYNDVFLMDQNACSSPRLVVWRGKGPDIGQAKELFWEAVYQVVLQKYDLKPIVAIEKYTQFCRDTIGNQRLYLRTSGDNYIYRIEMRKLPMDVDKIRGTSGYFVETSVEDLSEVAHIVNKKYQTLTYYGVDREDIIKFVLDNGLKGIDRIVPIGTALDFGLIWDGYDLIGDMSRECVVW